MITSTTDHPAPHHIKPLNEVVVCGVVGTLCLLLIDLENDSISSPVLCRRRLIRTGGVGTLSLFIYTHFAHLLQEPLCAPQVAAVQEK